MKNKPKVLLVGPFPPPFGGIARYTEDLYNSPIINEIELVKFNTNKYDGFRQLPLNKNVRNYRRIFYTKGAFIFSLLVLYSFIEYFIILLKLKPNIVHIHTCSHWGFIRSGIYIILAKALKIKSILHLHNAIDHFYFNETKSRIGKKIIRFIMNSANINITLSDGIKQMIEPIISSQVVSVYNATDTSLFNLSKIISTNRCIRFLYVGAVGPQKGAWDILKAISLLTNYNIDIKFEFIFIGRGEIEVGKKLCHKYKISSFVNFLGVVSEQEKNNRFFESDVFVLPSYDEGQPISILEAMAAGLVVISTRVGSIPEVIKHEINGFLIEPGDCEAMAKYFYQLIVNDTLRKKIGEINFYKARSNFDINRLYKDIKSIYEKLSF